jgi:GxxExxY protein
MYTQLSDYEELLGKQIVDIAFRIHKQLGPGLLESVYEKCFVLELAVRNIPFVRQQAVEINYLGQVIEDALRLDILVDNLVIVELKATDNPHAVWEAQLLSYLKLTNKRLGFIINFHVPLIKDGIKRMIL